jgi:hypothetical protein
MFTLVSIIGWTLINLVDGLLTGTGQLSNVSEAVGRLLSQLRAVHSFSKAR